MQFSDRVENIVGKEEIVHYEQFLLFPQCFQKLSIVDALKQVSMEQRINNIHCKMSTFCAVMAMIYSAKCQLFAQ